MGKQNAAEAAVVGCIFSAIFLLGIGGLVFLIALAYIGETAAFLSMSPIFLFLGFNWFRAVAKAWHEPDVSRAEGEAKRRQQEARKEQERIDHYKATGIFDLDRMTGEEFEGYVAELLRHQGFDIEFTSHSGDFGVDIVARKPQTSCAIRVKRHEQPVSQNAVRDAVAGKARYKCTGAAVVTNSTFTEGAREFASSTECRLVDREVLKNWIADFKGRPDCAHHTP